jgi:hypothetical protein
MLASPDSAFLNGSLHMKKCGDVRKANFGTGWRIEWAWMEWRSQYFIIAHLRPMQATEAPTSALRTSVISWHGFVRSRSLIGKWITLSGRHVSGLTFSSR